MLRALDVDVVALRSELPTTAPDTEVFKHLSASGRILVTEDRKQLTRMCEAYELRKAGISAVYFTPFWGGLELWGQAEWLVKRWPMVDNTQRGLKRGTVVEVQQNGKSSLVPP